MATVKELREQAKAAEIKGYGRMKKAELEAVLSIQTTTMTEITEHMLEGFKKEIKTFKNRAEAESFLNGLTVKELKVLYKYLVMYTYGEWYRMRKAEFIEEILDYYFEREFEESTEETSEVTEEAKAALKNLTAEDDFNGVSVKMIHNNECIENTSTESELEDLLNTADEYTLRYMLHRKGYETEKAESECTRAELVKAYVKEEMQLRREAKALDELGHSGLIAKTRELKKQLDAFNSESEMEEILKSYTKAELVMMSANINNYPLKINYLQSRDKLARDFAHEYWFITRTLSEAKKSLTEKKHVTETTENEVRRVMGVITAVNYEPKATWKILKAQTENFRHAALQIFYVGLGGFWNTELQKKALIDGFIGVEETGKRQEYLKNTATWLRIGQDNLKYCRENEEFRQHLPEFEERQRYYQEWQEYLESYEGKKELSA